MDQRYNSGYWNLAHVIETAGCYAKVKSEYPEGRIEDDAFHQVVSGCFADLKSDSNTGKLIHKLSPVYTRRTT